MMPHKHRVLQLGDHQLRSLTVALTPAQECGRMIDRRLTNHHTPDERFLLIIGSGYYSRPNRSTHLMLFTDWSLK